MAGQRPAFWNSPRARSVLIQGLLAAAVLAFAAWVVDNTVTNLERLNVNSGFRFLWQPAGFAINQTLIPYSEDSSYAAAFIVSLLNTLVLSAAGIVLATVLGFAIGLGRLSGNWLVARLCTVYVETLRNIPLLLQIFFWYFAILRPLPGPRQSIPFLGGTALLNNRGLYLPAPQFEPGFGVVVLAAVIGIAAAILLGGWAARRQRLTGTRPAVLWPALACAIGLPLAAFLAAGLPLRWEFPALAGFNLQGGIAVIPEFVAMLLALSLYIAAFIAEIVRAGIQSVAKGQTEAARALGLSESQRLRLIVLPQALRVIIPPMTSQYLNLTKNSSLAIAVGFPDLWSVAFTTLNQSGRVIQVFLLVMGTYLMFSLLISFFLNWYNRRVALVER